MSMLLNTRAIINSINVTPLSPLESLILAPFSLSSACRKNYTVIPPAVIPAHCVLDRLDTICFCDAVGSVERHPGKGDLLIIILIWLKLA